MKQNIMKRWIKALRSGKYKQGQGTLKQYNSKGQAHHCCLGVLCELYNQEMKKNKKKILPEKICNKDFAYGYTKFGNKLDDLPVEVRKWAGMKNSMGEFYGAKPEITWFGDYKVEKIKESLADLNDNGKKFKTIANIIEKNWEVL
jgi:hypothetical protein